MTTTTRTGHLPQDCIGRPASKMLKGEPVFAFGRPTYAAGVVVMVDGVPHVQWEDRDQPFRLRGMVHTMRREGEQ